MMDETESPIANIVSYFHLRSIQNLNLVVFSSIIIFYYVNIA